MAELTGGINGPVKGKAGNLVFYNYRGKTFVRMRPRKRRKKKTADEKSNTTRFSRVQTWMKPIADFVKYGFKDYGTSNVGYRSAVSYALRNEAVQGTYPNQSIDPSLIRVTGGELLAPAFASAILEEGNYIRFTWDKGDVESIRRNDQAMLLVYSPEKPGTNHATVEYKVTGAFRKDGTDTLPVSPALCDQEFHMYLGFVDPDRTQQSDSLYLGAIFMPGLPQDELFKVNAATRKARASKKQASKIKVEDKILNIARNLQKMGLAPADIAAATGLSIEEIGN